MAIISFDFDDTLTLADWDMELAILRGYGPHHENIIMAKAFHAEGNEVIIVTARSPRSQAVIMGFIDEHQLPVKRVFFTSHTPKGPILKKLGVEFHFDDRDDQVSSAEAHGVRGIKVPHVLDDLDFHAKAVKQSRRRS